MATIENVVVLESSVNGAHLAAIHLYDLYDCPALSLIPTLPVCNTSV